MTALGRFLCLLVLLEMSVGASCQAMFVARGFVTDPSGAGIAGASVRLDSTSGTKVRETVTDTQGAFTFSGIAGGNYSLVVPAFNGFAQGSVPLHLTSSLSGIKIGVALESVQQDVTVGTEEPISTDAAANRDTITTTGDQLRKLPVFDQDYIAALTPFLDAASGSSGGATIIVDGVEMKSAGVSPSAIQEVRVNNDPYSSEFTRPGRGRIEIITKPGTQEFHGEGNFIVRDSTLNAKHFPAVVRPPESRRIFEGHIGGPVGHGGHTSFISSASYRQLDTASIVNALGPNGAINLNVATPGRNSQYTIRSNHDFSSNHRISVGYNYESGTQSNAGVGGLTLPEAGTNQSGREDDLIFNDRIIVSPTLINQLQITLEKDEDVTKSVTNAQSIQVNGSFIGGGAQADVARTENTIHMNEVLTWSHGRHYIRAGVQMPQFSRRAVDDHSNRLGTFGFASLADYANNTPYVFTAQQGVGRGIYWINEFGSFFQDQIKVNPKLQLVVGLRYDWQTFLPDNNNVAPRVSIAYAPDKGKTILRAGTGVFYDRTGGDFPSTVTLHNGSVLRSIQVQNPRYPSSATDYTTTNPPSIVRFDPGVRAPYAFQYSFGVERQLHKTVTVTAAYRGQVQVKSFRSRDANAPILPPNASISAVYARPNPAFGEIQQIESGGRSLLNALDLSFRGQAGRWFTGQAQYTLSRFETNTGGINSFPQNQYLPNDEWGRANQDRLHRFNLLGNINPDHWLSLGIGATLYSGAPYNETTGVDYFHTGLANARPAGVGRNTLETAGTASVDLLYDHDFFLTKARDDKAKVLSAGVSAFNVLNHTNYTSYIGDLSSLRFGQATASLAGRQLQFSLGYRF